MEIGAMRMEMDVIELVSTDDIVNVDSVSEAMYRDITTASATTYMDAILTESAKSKTISWYNPKTQVFGVASGNNSVVIAFGEDVHITITGIRTGDRHNFITGFLTKLMRLEQYA